MQSVDQAIKSKCCLAVESALVGATTGRERLIGTIAEIDRSYATQTLLDAAYVIEINSARRVLVVSPEICSGHLNFRNRDCHFIFGDVCTAVVIEPAEEARGDHWLIHSTRCATQFSNNIRNNAGFLRRATA